MTWRDELIADAPCDETTTRRLTQLEAVLAQITTGVVILEPVDEANHSALQLVMVNDVAACYFGRIGLGADKIADTEAGLRQCGLFELALMVSLTGQEHMHEGLAAPGPAASGQLVDLAITPLGCGTVTITFEDVTQRVRAGEA